jgi:hypothetical protein
LERAQRRLEATQQAWERRGDRRAYRRLHNAYEDVAKRQRDRDEAYRRFLDWQRENGRPGIPPGVVPLPLLPPPESLPGPELLPGPAAPGPELLPMPSDEPIPGGAKEL